MLVALAVEACSATAETAVRPVACFIQTAPGALLSVERVPFDVRHGIDEGFQAVTQILGGPLIRASRSAF